MKRLLLAASAAALLSVTPALAQNYAGNGDETISPVAPPAAAAGDCVPDAPCPSNIPRAAPAPSLALSAAPAEATGIIASIDVAAGMVTLDDDKSYSVPTTVALNDFMVGQKVKIAFMEKEGQRSISDVKSAEDAHTAPGANY
jgi:hypothetical protein